jgi:hypothetical protein
VSDCQSSNPSHDKSNKSSNNNNNNNNVTLLILTLSIASRHFVQDFELLSLSYTLVLRDNNADDYKT